MRKNPATRKSATIAFIFTVLLGALANAGPVYTTELPSTKLSAREALKTAKAGKIVFKCQRAKVSDSAGISKAKNAKTVFALDVKDSEAALDTIQNGGKGYKCQPLEWDAERRKLSNADTEDTEV
jgi:hypothetical protein